MRGGVPNSLFPKIVFFRWVGSPAPRFARFRRQGRSLSPHKKIVFNSDSDDFNRANFYDHSIFRFFFLMFSTSSQPPLPLRGNRRANLNRKSGAAPDQKTRKKTKCTPNRSVSVTSFCSFSRAGFKNLTLMRPNGAHQPTLNTGFAGSRHERRILWYTLVMGRTVNCCS